MEMLWKTHYWAFPCSSFNFKHVEVRREKILEPYIGDQTRPSSFNNIGRVVSCSLQLNRAFSHDVTAAILVFQNNGTAAMLVYLDNPVGVEFFSYVKTFFSSNKLA